MTRVQLRSRVEVVVEAPVPDVWRVVGDVTRTGEWSHECVRVRWLGDTTGPVPGARFRGRNRAGWVRWTRLCEIVAVDPPRAVTWRTVPTPLFPDSTLWRIDLEPAGAGTRIVQSFQVLRAPLALDRVYATLVPGHRDRDARLMQDLQRIGEVAARGSRS